MDDSRSRASSHGDLRPVSSNPQVQQLFARLSQEIEQRNPSNVIFFIVDFLCKYYPEHLAGFAAIWNGDPELERDRLLVVEFFRFQKLPTSVASYFTNAGFDTLEALCSITKECLADIENHNVRNFGASPWLMGHKIRLQQTFADIAGRVRAFRQEREKMLHLARLTTGHCDHPTVMTRTNAPNGIFPALTTGPNPLPRTRALPAVPNPMTIQPGVMTGVMGSSTSRPFVVAPMNSVAFS